MTHIIHEEFPKESFKLLKLPVQKGDRLIFQTDHEPETEVTVNNVQDGKGLLKHWKIASWRNDD